MANVVRDPKAHPDAIVADLAHNNVAKIDVNQVAFVYGSVWKQRYFTKVGDDYFPLPVQRDIGTHQWLKYFEIPNPCTSCHTDKSTAWAMDRMRQWPERSPWRLE